MLSSETLVEANPSVRATFDGHSWQRGSATGRLWVTPGLVDAGCGVAGYRESFRDPLLRAARAVAALIGESGVSTIRIAACSWAEYWHFQAVVNEAAGSSHTDYLAPAVIGGGPALVLEEPDSDRQRWIRTSDDLRSAADLAMSEQVGWLPVQTTDAEFTASVVRAAAERGLRVVLKGDAASAEQLRAGDLYAGVANLTRQNASSTALQVLLGWAAPHTAEIAASQAGRLLGRGVQITSELLNLHRTVFVRDSLNAPFLEENEPILPHVRWLLQMRRGVNYYGGKSALAEHAGLREPSRADAKIATVGWERLLETAARLFTVSPLRPASTSPQLTQLPGFGLKEELAVLQAAGVPLEQVLAAAVDSAWSGATPADNVLATDVDPGQGARFLTSLRPMTTGVGALSAHQRPA